MTSQELLDAGIKPCALFKELLSCNSIEEAQTKYSQFIGTKQVKEKIDWTGTVWEWLCTNDCFKGMCSIEGSNNQASNSEKKRWLENGSVLLNGNRPKPLDKMDNEVWELVFFNGKRTITMV